jgi:hypothetical protein
MDRVSDMGADAGRVGKTARSEAARSMESTYVQAAAAEVKPAAAKMKPAAAEVAPAAEMTAPAAVATSTVTTSTVAAPAACLRGERNSQRQCGRQQDGAEPNFMSCHDHLPGLSEDVTMRSKPPR